MQIRPFQKADLAACLAVFDSNVPLYFTQDERLLFEEFLASLPGPYTIVEDAGEVVACGGFARSNSNSNIVNLCWGMVHRDKHVKGYGTAMLKGRLAEITQNPEIEFVDINTSQHTAPFFESNGFATLYVTKDGYGPGLDRYDMRLTVRPKI
ncbi:MAG: GNAT family N-acetyltransferase [Sandaracinaceae bacterium]|jgi:N-acetylglutamate synthase-like GNAT family acetyltransferase|nr:GNAT family N-acetyltransferase [Sandaracinaceae bacterium]